MEATCALLIAIFLSVIINTTFSFTSSKMDPTICRDFNGLPGSCRYGYGCRFAHMEDVGSWERGKPERGQKQQQQLGPILIPIAPQCAGKTRYLAEVPVGAVIDCSIDDVQGVYMKVSVEDLLYSSEKVQRDKLRKVVNGRTMYARCAEVIAGEQGLVLLLLTGAISLEIFVDRILALNLGCSDVIPTFLQVCSEYMETVRSENRMTSKTVDIFIREAVFPYGVTNAQANLQHAVATRPECSVAWGNTNLRSKDYECALQLAEWSGRPVEFIRWGDELPRLDISELLRRNLQRFVATGRYIPVITIEKCLNTAELLVTSHTTPIALAAAAGYVLDPVTKRVTRQPAVPLPLPSVVSQTQQSSPRPPSDQTPSSAAMTASRASAIQSLFFDSSDSGEET